MSGKEILDLPMNPDNNDAGAETVRDYLKELLHSLWDREAGFEGAQPFGTKGWQEELMIPLYNAGLVKGEAFKDDETGEVIYLKNYDKEAHKLINKAIEAL